VSAHRHRSNKALLLKATLEAGTAARVQRGSEVAASKAGAATPLRQR